MHLRKSTAAHRSPQLDFLWVLDRFNGWNIGTVRRPYTVILTIGRMEKLKHRLIGPHHAIPVVFGPFFFFAVLDELKPVHALLLSQFQPFLQLKCLKSQILVDVAMHRGAVASSSQTMSQLPRRLVTLLVDIAITLLAKGYRTGF